jgi:hypothetical protein
MTRTRYIPWYDEFRFVLDQNAWWIFIELAHWNNSSPHPNILSWFRANQFVFFLLKAGCLAEKQLTPINSLWSDQFGARTYDLQYMRWTRTRCGLQVVSRSILMILSHSRLITRCVTRLTRWVPLVEKELLTLPEHISSFRFLVGFVLLDL